ncbi:MAG TPA: chemotaxis protein CheW [Chloroflexota bacterium]|nr:chemotaxis protein CheW [Chloroflexota bacterium]
METQSPITIIDPDYTPVQVAAILARRAQELAKPAAAETDGRLLHLLIFQLGQERYAIDAAHVLELYPPQPITPVPRTPDYVVGIFSARGRFLSVIDLQAVLALPGRSLLATSQIVVVQAAGIEVGFLADLVEDVTMVLDVEIEPPLTTAADGIASFIRGIAPGMCAIVELNALFEQKQLVVYEEPGA